MMTTNEKIAQIRGRASEGRKTKVMLIGLGSVGNYLLTYLLSDADENLEIVVVGRNEEKMRSDVNIATVAALIRGQCRTRVQVVGGIDLEDIDSVAACLTEHDPDIIVNSSRVYAGLKYGSISWGSVRAYGIWTPLAVRYIRNVVEACDRSGCNALVVNTSYSDATIPWLKSAGGSYPDFGSGNLNHIVPRLKLAAAELSGIDDFWNVEADLATAHFHDVVISKEGHDEGLWQLIRVSHGGQPLEVRYEELLADCAIPMPTDQKRNMMNASSNYDIIRCVLAATRQGERRKFFSPGAFGEIGGYPVVVDGTSARVVVHIDETSFSLDQMRERNRASIALDGVEDVRDGVLVYTDLLLDKAETAFGVRLPKEVHISDADEVAGFIVKEVIEPQLAKRA